MSFYILVEHTRGAVYSELMSIAVPPELHGSLPYAAHGIIQLTNLPLRGDLEWLQVLE